MIPTLTSTAPQWPFTFSSLACCYFHILILGGGLKLDAYTLRPHCSAVPPFAPLFLLSQVPNWILVYVFYIPDPDLADGPLYN